MAVVEFEFILGIALLSGLWPRLVWFAAMACFALFSGLTLYKALSGEASCGCFGRVAVNPWYTLVLDLSTVTALAIFRPRPEPVRAPPTPRYRLATAIVAILAAGVPSGIAIASYAPVAVSEEGDLVDAGGIVILEPEKWVGKPFPLLKYIDIGDQLAKGKWVVFLYHHDCPKCRKAIPKYLRSMAQEVGGQSEASRVAFVEMPPYGPYGVISPDGAYALGRLADKWEWFASTPLVVLLVDGKTTLASEGKSSSPDEIVARPLVPWVSQVVPRKEVAQRVEWQEDKVLQVSL
jgi:hypothetical protein